LLPFVSKIRLQNWTKKIHQPEAKILSNKNKPISIICGPTASGKSACALERADKKNGMIINADSLQMYQHLPLLTAQPDADARAQIPHRLYAILPDDVICSAQAWRQMAAIEIRAAWDAGQHPIIVGGTGFYLKSLIEGLSPIPDIPDDVRATAEDLCDKIGVKNFHASLAEKDPEMASRLHPHDRQRIIRAWEVLAHTGRSLAQWQREEKIDTDPDFIFDITCFLPERDVLYTRCDQRLVHMIDDGVVDEVRHVDDLIMMGKLDDNAPVTRALGFRAFQSNVRGDIPLETALLLAQTETRHYAKRQVTWFRHQITPQKNIAQIEFLS
jgi:tRNA dimethylallyltransferase